MKPLQSAIGVVIIGRNEGTRLVACLQSLADAVPQVVYVDSASTDQSLTAASKHGAHALSLDMRLPFTAARARNAGLEKILSLYPSIQLVQFVDGDCIMDANWLATASTHMQSHLDVAVVCGRRREIYPQKSLFNYMCDLEWNTPIGNTKACGGDALMRVDVVRQVGAYRDSLIAGEEPELCIRIRQAGYKIWRLDAEMTMHDAAMYTFKQWWKRAMRAGYAYAEGAHLHGGAPEYHWVAESKRAWLWGLWLPLAIVAALLIMPLLAGVLLLIYPLQMLRLSLKSKQTFKRALAIAFFTIIGKFAETAGQLKFVQDKYFKRQGKIIEYK